MSKKDEALKLALEALESCEMSNYGRDWVWPATAHETAMKNVKEAITAIREALAEQPAQPEQEHVAQKIWEEGAYGPEITELRDIPVGAFLYMQPAQPGKPLTDEQEYEAIGTAGNDLLALAKRWADNEIHVYQFDNEARKIIKAVLHRAHGIKGDA